MLLRVRSFALLATRHRSLAGALLGWPAAASEVVGGVDQGDVREGLREVADQASRTHVVLFRQQSDVVA